jgi:hypothetical protein
MPSSIKKLIYVFGKDTGGFYSFAVCAAAVYSFNNIEDFEPRTTVHQIFDFAPDIRIFAPIVCVRPGPKYATKHVPQGTGLPPEAYSGLQHEIPQGFRRIFTDGDFLNAATVAVPFGEGFRRGHHNPV